MVAPPSTSAPPSIQTSVRTDALLIQATLSAEDRDQLSATLKGLRSALLGSSFLQPGKVHAALAPRTGQMYAYLYLTEPLQLEHAVAATLEATLQAASPLLQQLRVSRLEKVFDQAGASADTPPAYHYVVEMDPETGWMPQLSDWYDTEHMPGLAHVPGCVRASRFLNHDHGPLSLACYDLVTQDTLGSPAWLAVRETDWSSRMRPHFTNTLRTMFDLAADARHPGPSARS